MSSTLKVIQPSGILDSISGNQLRREVTDLSLTEGDIVLLDCQDITFIDSSGLGALVTVLKRVRELGGRFVICSVNEQMQMLFTLTGMASIFEVFPDRETFSQSMPIA